MSAPIVLSGFSVQPLLTAHRAGAQTARVSLDLGLTLCDVALTAEGVVLPAGQRLCWATLDEIATARTACYVVESDSARKIHVFSSKLDRAYSLMATAGAPTLVNAGFTMHRIVDIDPHADTLRKIAAIAPIRGRVLDTVTGLGYTAIEAAHGAERVVTVELDPAVLEVARLNPWSQALFENPRITQLVGDSYDVVEGFEAESFTRIMHDPPSFSLAGELYSGEYYRRLFRVLRRGGRLFHYIGRLESRHGRTVTRGVLRRLHDAGFARITRRPEAFGLVAYKD